MTKNKLSDAKSIFATVKSESDELFRETEVYLSACDEKNETRTYQRVGVSLCR